jgi:DNA-binding transcriptional ArsR family regulator
MRDQQAGQAGREVGARHPRDCPGRLPCRLDRAGRLVRLEPQRARDFVGHGAAEHVAAGAAERGAHRVDPRSGEGQLVQRGQVLGRAICDLTAPLGLAQPTVSHHMRQLAEADLVTREQRGKWAHYRVVPEATVALSDTLRGPAA